MTTIALAVFFLLFAIMNLFETKIPVWVLGIAALFVVLALVLSGGWKNKTTILTVLLLPVCLLCGCAQFILPSKGQLEALGKDPNSIRLKVATIYGTMELDRNMDRITLATTNSGAVLVVPQTTLKTVPVQ